MALPCPRGGTGRVVDARTEDLTESPSLPGRVAGLGRSSFFAGTREIAVTTQELLYQSPVFPPGRRHGRDRPEAAVGPWPAVLRNRTSKPTQDGIRELRLPLTGPAFSSAGQEPRKGTCQRSAPPGASGSLRGAVVVDLGSGRHLRAIWREPAKSLTRGPPTDVYGTSLVLSGITLQKEAGGGSAS